MAKNHSQVAINNRANQLNPTHDVNFTFMFPVISLLCFHLFHSKFPRGNKV